MRRWLTGAAAVIAGMLAITFGVLSGPLPAQATDAHAFDPAEIISDANFYDSNAMTATDVQNFLNQHVPTCHPEWDGSLASTIVCLKDYHQQTTAKSADAYCNGYSSQWQSAAQIIDGVARSCGVSQKVILVTLQKESALVNHPDPSPWRYASAMGYACPDDAPCDAQYNGLFNQIYNAARQFKLYQAKPSSYQYRAGQNNYIQWNPNASCGGSIVYIRNQATAGLYNYTPYQPNAAALNAGYGTGDGCSTYGNRNFFLWYSDWFGDPTGNSALGALVASRTCTLVGGGCITKFTNGRIYEHSGVTAIVYNGDFDNEWSKSDWPWQKGGWENGPLGYPTGDQLQLPTTTSAGQTVWMQNFQGGRIYAYGGRGYTVFNGHIMDAWVSQNYEHGWLGYPTGDQLQLPKKNSSGQTVWMQNFQGGRIYATGTTAYIVYNGAIDSVWAAAGWENGRYGYPTDNLQGNSQTFEGGRITAG